MKDIYITIYTKEKGKLEFTEEECDNFDVSSVTYHRLDGPAVIYSNGHQEYWVNDQLHRFDGPAVIHSDGYQVYWVNGKRHRLDGPAIIDHNETQYYLIDDNLYTEAEFNQIINEARKLTKTERLIDERWWVREFI